MSSHAASTQSGRRIVRWIFAMALTIAVAFGYLVGSIIRNDADVAVGVWTVGFRPTPVNMALYGGLAVVAIGAVLYLTMEVASRFESNADD